MHAGSSWLGGTLRTEPEQPIFLRYNLLNTFDFFKQRCKREILLRHYNIISQPF